MTKTTPISQIMTKKLETIGTRVQLRKAAKKMRDKNVSSLLVIDDFNDGKPIGIVTERDLVRQVCVNDSSSKHTIIRVITSSPLVTVDATSSVEVVQRFDVTE